MANRNHIILLLIFANMASITLVYGVYGSSPHVVQASDILVKLEAHEPVDYDNVTIVGYLDLSRALLPLEQVKRTEFEETVGYLSKDAKIVDSSIRIKNSEVNGSFNLDNVIFENSVSFENTKFGNNSSFRGAFFQRNISFYNSSFNRNAYYEFAQFGEDINFEKTKFDEEAHLLEAQFNGTAHFENAHFSGFQDFRNARFKSLSYFEGADFDGDSYFDGVYFLMDADFRSSEFVGFADFSGSKFEEATDFRGAKFWHDAFFPSSRFMGETYFSEAKFDKYAEFMGTRFGDNAYFWDTRFMGNADFWNSQFTKRADFNDANFDKNADFHGSQFSDSRSSLTTFSRVAFNGNTSFAEAQLSPISDFRYSNFNISLNLTYLGFDHLKLNWKDIKYNLICDESVYISLVKNFQNSGQYDDADNCYYQYRRYRQDHSEFGLSRFVDTLAGIVCGYGVRPQYIIVWGIFLILAFSIFFYKCRAIQLTGPNTYAIQNNDVRYPTFLDALYFSILVFFVSLPPQDWRTIERWRFLVMVEDLIGWLLITLFVVVLGHVLIR